MNYKFLWLWITIMVLASCKVTQPYQSPSALIPKTLYRDTTDIPSIDTMMTTDTTSMASLSWKQIFTDTLLQSLIQEGINNNFDLKIAVTRIKEAEANFRQSKAAFLPSLNANADVTFQKPTPVGGSNQLYETFLSSGWTVDLWGRLKSARQAELAALLQSYAYKKAVQTQLVANIAANYYALLAYDQELTVTTATVANRKEDVTVTTALKEGDVLTGAAVMQSQANVYSAEVSIPDLKENIRQTENAISILLARNPGIITRDSLGDQKVITDLKTGLPMQLLANRPDVQEAEYQLRNATELTNVARTYFYPALTITAEGGLSGSNPFNALSVIGNIIGGLTQPIFNNGLNKQRLELAKGLQEELLYTFQKTLLTAGQEVSNALYDYQSATNKITIRSSEIFYLQKSVDYTKELMKYNDKTNYTDVLTSEQNLLAAQLSGIADKLQQLQAVVTLYTSLGGGWK